MRSTDLVLKVLLCHPWGEPLGTVSVTSLGHSFPVYAVCIVASNRWWYHQPYGVTLRSEFIPGKCRVQGQAVRRHLLSPVLQVLKFYNQDYCIHHLNIIRETLSVVIFSLKPPVVRGQLCQWFLRFLQSDEKRVWFSCSSHTLNTNPRPQTHTAKRAVGEEL